MSWKKICISKLNRKVIKWIIDSFKTVEGTGMEVKDLEPNNKIFYNWPRITRHSNMDFKAYRTEQQRNTRQTGKIKSI